MRRPGRPRLHAPRGGGRAAVRPARSWFFSFFVSPAAAERSGAKLPHFRTRCINGFANLRHPKRYEDHRTPSPWCPSPSETPPAEKPAAGSRPRTAEPAAGPRRDASVPNSRRAREIGAGGRPKMGQRVPVRATIRRGALCPRGVPRGHRADRPGSAPTEPARGQSQSPHPPRGAGVIAENSRTFDFREPPRKRGLSGRLLSAVTLKSPVVMLESRPAGQFRALSQTGPAAA